MTTPVLYDYWRSSASYRVHPVPSTQPLVGIALGTPLLLRSSRRSTLDTLDLP